MELKINIGNDFDSKAVIAESDKTVTQVYKEAGIPLAAGAILTLNGTRLGASDANRTLADLGVADGSYVTISGKLNSAR